MADTAFRKKLAGRDTGVELQIVLEDLLASWSPKLDNEDARFACKPHKVFQFFFLSYFPVISFK